MGLFGKQKSAKELLDEELRKGTSVQELRRKAGAYDEVHRCDVQAAFDQAADRLEREMRSQGINDPAADVKKGPLAAGETSIARLGGKW